MFWFSGRLAHELSWWIWYGWYGRLDSLSLPMDDIGYQGLLSLSLCVFGFLLGPLPMNQKYKVSPQRKCRHSSHFTSSSNTEPIMNLGKLYIYIYLRILPEKFPLRFTVDQRGPKRYVLTIVVEGSPFGFIFFIVLPHPSYMSRGKSPPAVKQDEMMCAEVVWKWAVASACHIWAGVDLPWQLTFLYFPLCSYPFVYLWNPNLPTSKIVLCIGTKSYITQM